MLCTGQPLHAFDLDEVRGRADRRAPRGRGRDDDHARRRRSAPSPPRWRSCATRRGRAGSPASWAGRSRRCPTSTTRVLMEAATWVGPNIMRTSKALGLRTEASRALREAAAPRAGDRGPAAGGAADGRAVRRPAGAGHDRRVPASRPSRAWCRCAPRGWSGCSASAIPDGRPSRRSSSGSASAVEPRRRRTGLAGRGGAAVARQRRPARGRPDRGGRADPRPGQAAHDAAGARASGRAADRQPASAPPARGSAARPRAATRRSRTASPRRRRSTRLRLGGRASRCGSRTRSARSRA